MARCAQGQQTEQHTAAHYIFGSMHCCWSSRYKVQVNHLFKSTQLGVAGKLHTSQKSSYLLRRCSECLHAALGVTCTITASSTHNVSLLDILGVNSYKQQSH